MEYATEEQLKKAISDENYTWAGWQFWNAFATLPKKDKIRKYHVKIWDKMLKEQQSRCEHGIR